MKTILTFHPSLTVMTHMQSSGMLYFTTISRRSAGMSALEKVPSLPLRFIRHVSRSGVNAAGKHTTVRWCVVSRCRQQTHVTN